MNSSLTNFLEVLKEFKIRKLAKPKYGTENQPLEQKLKSRGAEGENYAKILNNLNMDHKRLKNRLEKVGNPNYTIELRK